MNFPILRGWSRGLLLILLSSGSEVCAEAEAPDRTYDYSFVTGVTFGVVTDRARKKGNQAVGYGGLPLNVRLTTSSISDYSLTYQGGILLDFGNNQVIKKGGETGIAYHVIGGSRRVKKVNSLGTLVGSSSSDLSLLGRIGFYQFSASSAKDPTDSVTGSMVDFKVGGGYRHDLFQASTLALEVLLGVYSIPASSERLAHSTVDIGLVWRMEI